MILTEHVFLAAFWHVVLKHNTFVMLRIYILEGLSVPITVQLSLLFKSHYFLRQGRSKEYGIEFSKRAAGLIF